MEMATALVFDVLVTPGDDAADGLIVRTSFLFHSKIEFDHILCTYFMRVFMTTLQFEVETTLL
jgi:hypothetical protein